MKIMWLLVFGMFWAGGASALQGREIEVKEVTISLYSRPVNGYRLVLDRKMSSVTNQILRHVSSKGAGSPFQYEHTIIYENIRYAPITNDRDISLYFLVRTVETQFTELTAVAMYDYKRSINPRDFPDLSENLLRDLADLVHRISGDGIRFLDKVFVDGNTLVAENGSEPTQPVEQFKEEEVENNSVLVKQDPFKKTLTPTEQLTAQNQLLRDSLRKVSRELAEINKRYMNADEVSVGNTPNAQMAELRKELEVAKARMNVYQQRNDSIIQANREVMALVDKMGQEEAKYRPQIEELRKENTRLIAEVNDLRVRAGEKPIANPGNTERVANLERALEQEIETTRRLKAQSEKLTDENNFLSGQLDKRTEELTLAKTRLAAAEKAGTMPPGMRDSLQLLTMRANKADQLAEENARLNRLLESQGDNDSRLLREMQSMQARNATLVEDRNSLEKENAELKETLNQTLVTLSELNGNSKALLDRYALLEQQGSNQKEAIDKMEKVIRANQVTEKALMDSIRTEKQLQGRLSAEISDRDRTIARERRAQDSLRNQLQFQESQLAASESKNRAMQTRLDSLTAMQSQPLDDQQRFIREQWTKLENWEREQKALKKSLEEKELLLTRREEVLREREAQLTAAGEKEKNLSERENALKIQTQQNKTQPVGEEVGVTPASLNERGQVVPIFEVRSSRTYKGAQQLVAAYMNKRGLLFDEKFPDMLYESVLIPELSDSPVTLRMRIEAFGTGSVVRVSVRMKDGSYINGLLSNGGGQKVEQFLKEMFRFAL